MRKLFAVTSLIVAPLAFVVPQTALAQWTGDGNLGFSQSSGNSESESLSAGLNAGYETGKWLHTAYLSAFNASADDERSAESYGAGFKSDYAFTEKTYGWGGVRLIKDNYGAYEQQVSLSTGIGQHFIDDGITLFDGEIGIGYRDSEFQDGTSVDEEILTGKLVYNRQLTESTAWDSYVLAESGSDNTYLEGSMGVRVAMSEALGLSLAYVVKHNTDVPAGTEKSDKYSTVAVTYNF